MTYRISVRANADIETICDFVAKDRPVAASKLDQRIHDAIKLLAEFPGMGHGRTDVADKRYLFWTVSSYVIAYRMEGNQLIVVRVLHGARDFRTLFPPSKQ